MKKLFAVLSVVFMLCAGLSACAGNKISEQGNWKLEFFSEGEKIYSVGDEYMNRMIAEDFYTCSFECGKYCVKKQGETVRSGEYTAEKSKDGTVCIAVAQGDKSDLWTCGIRAEADGKETLCITARIGNNIVSFIPAA